MRLPGRAGAAAVAALAVALAGAVAAVAMTSGRAAAPPAELVSARSHGTALELAAPYRARTVLPAHLVVLGDSVASGAGCSCRPFGPLVARLATDRTHRSTQLTMLAHDGLTTAGLLTQVRQDSATIAALRGATTVTVTIGANDFDSSRAESGCEGTGTACFAADLQALPDELGAVLYRIRSLAGAQVQVLVTGYWNVFLDGAVAAQHGSTYQSTSDALTRQVDAVLAATAGAHAATYVDLYRAFRGDGDTDDTTLLAADGDHPSAAGHRLIAWLLTREVAGR